MLQHQRNGIYLILLMVEKSSIMLICIRILTQKRNGTSFENSVAPDQLAPADQDPNCYDPSDISIFIINKNSILNIIE